MSAVLKDDIKKYLGIKVSISLCLLAGNELLYRNREGDVVKFNVDADEKVILVHNKKFVSLSSASLVSLTFL